MLTFNSNLQSQNCSPRALLSCMFCVAALSWRDLGSASYFLGAGISCPYDNTFEGPILLQPVGLMTKTSRVVGSGMVRMLRACGYLFPPTFAITPRCPLCLPRTQVLTLCRPAKYFSIKTTKPLAAICGCEGQHLRMMIRTCEGLSDQPQVIPTLSLTNLQSYQP